MNPNSPIEYHLDILTLKDFVNQEIQLNKMTAADGETIFNCLKSVVLCAELKPFLTAPVGEKSDTYYEKYVRLESEQQLNTIPDFFSSNGDFYELNRHYYIHLEEISFEIFATLFAIKLQELESLNLSIKDFLDFQIFDNFSGDKESVANLCYYLLEVAGNFRLLPAISDKLKDWMQSNNLIIDNNNAHFDSANTVPEILENDSDHTNMTEEDTESTLPKEEPKDFKIEGNFSDDEINKFFSFLYLEKSCDNKPYLEEIQVIDIFKNGLTIPAIPTVNKYKLNIDPRFPKKIIDYAIHLFFTKHSHTFKGKAKFLKFFGSYIEDYKAALESDQKLTMLISNITGETSSKNKILWNKYLPERHHI